MSSIRAVYSILTVTLVAGIWPSFVLAKNVDLSTVPPRDRVQLTIYNSENITLVREWRSISLKRGNNPLQFSWANTLIDPSSVSLRFSANSDVEVVDATFPHDKPEMLYWNVHSIEDRQATAEITYFTSGISWSADYVGLVDPTETTMAFDGYVKITNQSGEDYDNAEMRLVVGTINLVEKIDSLARRGMISEDDAVHFKAQKRMNMSRRARKEVAAMYDQAMPAAAEAKQIIKEGLSEYFIFTVPGTETVKHQWSKRMQLFDGTDVPFSTEYRFRQHQYGQNLVRFFLARNNESSNLGSTPLPDGFVRVFRKQNGGGLSLMAQQQVDYVPIGQKIELNLGVDPEVILEHVRLGSWRDELWFHRNGGRILYNPNKGHRIKVNDRLVGWDEHEQWVERIRNYRKKPIAVEIQRRFNGHVVLKCDSPSKLHDVHTARFRTTVPGQQKHEIKYEVVYKNGENAKQNKIYLEG